MYELKPVKCKAVYTSPKQFVEFQQLSLNISLDNDTVLVAESRDSSSSSDDDEQLSVAGIAVAAGIAFLLLLAFIVCCCYRQLHSTEFSKK